MMHQDTLEEYNQRTTYLSQIPIYREVDIVSEAAKYFTVRYFDRHDIVAEEGKGNKYLNFILKGQVRVVKNIPFIRHGKNKMKIDRGQSLGINETRFKQPLTLAFLDPGRAFPEALPSSLHSEKSKDKVSLMSKVADLDALGHNTPFATCVCECPTIVLSIGRVDFIRTMGVGMLEALNEDARAFTVPVRELQEQWMKRGTWEGHKKSIVGEIHMEYRAERELKRRQFETEYGFGN